MLTPAPASSFRIFADLLASHGVEAVHRLIQYQQIGLMQQALRELDPLSHALGELPHPFRPMLAGQSHFIQHRDTAVLHFRSRDARKQGQPSQPIQRAQFPVNGFSFGAVTDPAQDRRVVPRNGPEHGEAP